MTTPDPRQTRRTRATLDVLLVIAAIAIDLVVWGADTERRDGGRLPAWIIPTATVLVYSFLLFRHRQPLLVFALLWCYGLIGVAVPGYEAFVGILIALYAAASRLPTATAVASLSAMVVPFGVNSWNAALSSNPEERGSSLFISVVLWTVLAVGTWSVGRTRYTTRRRNQLARDEQSARAANALIEERRRLARELHDIVAHSVTVMILQAAGARALIEHQPGAAVHQALEAIEQSGVEAMNELHRLLALLRGPDDESSPALGRQPTLNDLPDLIRRFTETGLHLSYRLSGSPGTLDPSVALAAYRLTQEALTNTVKHAGPTATVTVTGEWSDDAFTLTITDERDARTTVANPALSSGYGLTGLAERLQLIGVRLEAGPTEHGFCVRSRLPRSPNARSSFTNPESK